MSDSLWPHESQHARPPYPSPTPRVYPNSCPSSRWCHPAISSSVVPFSSCPQSLPALGSFPMSQLFAWGGQSIGVSASASVLPMNTQDWSPLEWTGWTSCCPRDSQESSPTPQFKSINSSALSFLHSPTFTSIHDHRKNHSLYYMAQWFVESKTEYFKYTKSSPVLIKISRGTLLELNKAVLKFTCKNKCISILMKTLTK